MKTYKFNIKETETLYIALVSACSHAKKELEEDIELDLHISCKSIVERDKQIYGILNVLKEIVREHNKIKIEGD